jgi:hypothetical protein
VTIVVTIAAMIAMTTIAEMTGVTIAMRSDLITTLLAFNYCEPNNIHLNK